MDFRGILDRPHNGLMKQERTFGQPAVKGLQLLDLTD